MAAQLLALALEMLSAPEAQAPSGSHRRHVPPAHLTHSPWSPSLALYLPGHKLACLAPSHFILVGSCGLKWFLKMVSVEHGSVFLSQTLVPREVLIQFC